MWPKSNRGNRCRPTVHPEWLSRGFGLVQATELVNGSNERFFQEIELQENTNPKLGFAPMVSKTKFKLHGISNKFVVQTNCVGEICQFLKAENEFDHQ